MRPIFIGITRSFWLGIMPAVLTLLDVIVALVLDDANHGPVAAALALILPWSAAQIMSAMQALTPLCALIVAHQRRGQNRPYTTDPRAL